MKRSLKLVSQLVVLLIFVLSQVSSNIVQAESTTQIATYSISGRVIDANGNPLSGITVQANMQSYPVILVHGFRGFPPLPIGCERRFDPTTNAEAVEYFGDVGIKLENYLSVRYAHLVSNPCYTASIAENALRLSNDIQEVKNSTGAQKVILVAHSMGGIVSRAYIENNLNYRNDVDTLITIGSPHLGVPLDIIAFAASGATLGVFCDNYQPGMCDLSGLGMNEFNITHRDRTNGVRYYTVSGDLPTYARSAVGETTDLIFKRAPNDGLVGLSSGLGLQSNNGVTIGSFATDEGHGNQFDNQLLGYHWSYFVNRQTPFAQTTDSKTYSQCLAPLLVRNSYQCNSELSSSAADLQNAEGENNQRTAFTFHTLLPGQAVTQHVLLQSGPAQFLAYWSTGTVIVTLEAPDGRVIDPSYAVDHPDEVTYSVDANGAVYQLTSASAGEWKMHLLGTELPSEGTTVTTFAAFSSNLTLSGETSKSWYITGESAKITATLQGGQPDNVQVTAKITYPNSTSVNLPLLPVGNGSFEASTVVPPSSGYTGVSITAVGTIIGEPFERSLDTAFMVAPETIELTSIYGEEAKPSASNANSIVSLDITVGVKVKTPGNYGLSADIVDLNGKVVAHANASANFSSVTTTIPDSIRLVFDGVEIYRSAINGPYKLTNVLLTDLNSTLLPVTEAKNVYTTKSYKYDQFEGENIVFLPLIANGGSSSQLLSMGIIDANVQMNMAAGYTTTTDANGYYTFNHLTPGDYKVAPIKTGETFTPPYQSIMLWDNFTNQNFRMNVPPNQPPYPPTNPWPGNGMTSVSINTNLTWAGGDPDGNTVTYSVYFESGDSTPDVLVANNQTQKYYRPATLSANTIFYWQIISRDSNGAITQGPVWSFTTVNSGEMVLIPAGPFQMGCDPNHNGGWPSCPSQELPLHIVNLDAYRIDKYEVTNGQYAQCVAAGNCVTPSSNSSRSRASYYGNPTYANYPVIYVSWQDATNYCAWGGKRLPTEAEWEKGARGSLDTRAFPWGDASPTCSLVNFSGSSDCVGDTSAVGSYPAGASPYGVMDMAGNVVEWVSDWFQSNYYIVSPASNPQGPASGNYKVLRGGRWDLGDWDLRIATRANYIPTIRTANFGFRCAAPPGN